MIQHKQPLAEIFGHLVDDQSPQAIRYRSRRLCPFNNKVPNCTKDKAKDPLGVCSVFHNDTPVITCPIRFREDWLITDDAALFSSTKALHGAPLPKSAWTTLKESQLVILTLSLSHTMTMEKSLILALSKYKRFTSPEMFVTPSSTTWKIPSLGDKWIGLVSRIIHARTISLLPASDLLHSYCSKGESFIHGRRKQP